MLFGACIVKYQNICGNGDKSMKIPLVSVVVPTFNRKNDLLRCLGSLMESSYKHIEVIVVDNGSTDGTCEAVKNFHPNVKLINLDKNTGVTGGRNAGAKIAMGDLLLFLDHDMVVDERMLEVLVNLLLEDEKIGSVGPVIYYLDDPNRVWSAGSSINMLTGKISANTEVHKKAVDVQVLPAVILARKELLEKLGFYDNVFFAVYEDTDICFRIKKAGYKVICTSKAIAWHNVPLDPALQEVHVLSRSYYIARNKILFMKKHAAKLNSVFFLMFFMPIFAAYYSWRSLRIGKLAFLENYWRGVFDGLKTNFSAV